MTVTKMRIPGRPSLGLVHTGEDCIRPGKRKQKYRGLAAALVARQTGRVAGMAILSSPRGRGFDRARAHFLRVRWASLFLGRVPDAQQNHVRDPPLPRRHSRRSSGSRAERCRVTSVRGRSTAVSDPSPAAQQGLRPMFRMEQRWWPANSPARWKDAR